MNPLEQYEHDICRLAFASYRNINAEAAARFASKGITPEAFFSYDAAMLRSLTGVKKDFFDNDRRKAALDAARIELDFISSNRINSIYSGCETFPARLTDCSDAPAVLFALGNVPVRPKHVISIVGTRHCTAYGVEFTRRLIKDLAETVDDLIVISGLAYGIDITAHRAALDAGVKTGAVLAHGLNTIYPAEHRNDAQRIVKNGGFLLTEYRSDAHIHKGNFLARNRIVAGLADATIIIESDIKGGAMTTANIASAYGRDVFALPGKVTDTYSRGCNALIANNTAAIIRDALDLTDAMRWQTRKKSAEQPQLPLLNDEQIRVIDFLKDNPLSTINQMCVALNRPYATLTSILFALEMDGLLIAVPGGRYELTASAR